MVWVWFGLVWSDGSREGGEEEEGKKCVCVSSTNPKARYRVVASTKVIPVPLPSSPALVDGRRSQVEPPSFVSFEMNHRLAVRDEEMRLGDADWGPETGSANQLGSVAGVIFRVCVGAAA